MSRSKSAKDMRHARKAKEGPDVNRNDPVLIALSATDNRDDALVRAALFARVFDAELQVLRVAALPTEPPETKPGSNAEGAFSVLRREHILVQRTWRWCNRRLVSPILPVQVSVRFGEFSGAVTWFAREIGPQMVVIPGSDVHGGEEVLKIAANTLAPVLVSRPARTGETLVAATDLSSERVPVLAFGSMIGSRLGSCVVFVHNVLRTEPDAGDHAAELIRSRENTLRSHAAELGPDIECVVSSSPDTAGAVLRAAAAAEADLLVVGVRHKTWLEGVFGAGVAARVIERTDASVVAVPFDGDA
jgi:nucleotide-binding universal stress UspA family protein